MFVWPQVFIMAIRNVRNPITLDTDQDINWNLQDSKNSQLS